MSDPRTLAVIPARSGSRGVPRKNLRRLAGRTLIARTVEEARRAGRVQRVVVSTDGAEIAAAARAAGAEAIVRPAELSGDRAPSEAALLHALDQLREREGYDPELLVFLQCTSPLTLAEDIDGTIRELLDRGADSALAVTSFHHFLWRQDPDGRAAAINHDPRVRPMRQEREPQYLETGAVYVMRTTGFRQARHRFFGKIAMYVMPAERNFEIDTPFDLAVAGSLVRRQERDHALARLPETIQALVLDFDGVLTDNRVLVAQDGTEAVMCDRSDGMGLSQLGPLGLPILVLTRETNPVARARCDKLGLACIHGVTDKLTVLKGWLAERGIAPEHTVYVGNDTNDVACLGYVGCGVAVRDAHPQAIAAAKFVLSRRGGRGAVREIADRILMRMGGRQHASQRAVR